MRRFRVKGRFYVFLIALALVTVVLAAIGSVTATNMRGVRALEQRVALVESARLVVTDLSRGSELPGGDHGVTSGHRWQFRTTPFFDHPGVVNSVWTPQLLELRVQSPSGATLSLSTVRLQKRGRRS